MDSRKALQIAWLMLHTDHPEAAETIDRILKQRGCHHDPYAEDDQLTTLIDLIVFG